MKRELRKKYREMTKEMVAEAIIAYFKDHPEELKKIALHNNFLKHSKTDQDAGANTGGREAT